MLDSTLINVVALSVLITGIELAFAGLVVVGVILMLVALEKP